MRYIKYSTLEDNTKLDFYIEVDQDNMEVRKIEFAEGEILGFASKEFSFRGTIVAKTALLLDEEITSGLNNYIFNISKEDFESLWERIIVAAGNINKE